MTSYGSLLQPIYDTLGLIFPEQFLVDPFFSFVLNCCIFYCGLMFCYMVYVWPVRMILRAFKTKVSDKYVE